MSFPRKKSSLGYRTGAKSKGQAGSDGPGTHWERELMLDSGPLAVCEGQGQGQKQGEGGKEAGISNPPFLQWLLEADSESEPEQELGPEPEMIQAGATALKACETRPNTPVSDREGPRGSVSQFVGAHTTVLQPQTLQGSRAVQRFLSPESRAAEAAAIWPPPVEAGPNQRGVVVNWGSKELMQACAAPWLRSPPKEGGRAPGLSNRRGARQQLNITTDVQRACGEGLVGLPSDPESYVELRDMQTGRASINLKRDGQAMQPTESPRYSISPRRENFPHVSGPFSTTALWSRDSTIERQVVGELGPSSPKKMQAWLSRRVGGKSSPPRGADAATGKTEALPQALPSRQLSPGKRSLGNSPEVVLGTALSPRRRRQLPVDPATIPPVTGISLLPKPGTSSLAWEPKQSKQGSPEKKSGARRQTQLVTRGDLGSTRAPDSRSHLPSQRYKHHESSSGDTDIQEPQVMATFKPLPSSRGSFTARGLVISRVKQPSSHQQTLKMPEFPPGIEGCPRCTVLEEEVQDLRNELDELTTVVIQLIGGKFQNI
ncbi:uncharacterized protein CXorf49-like [Ochotona princeps]|uniref:uncharacterized protein CXorf49-like n=1 Tax=Ochotona princeps TaxID=9978 RepID=UPI00271541E5|nr:uncharacterized protein CXorf49-like [Ochotona princeps]